MNLSFLNNYKPKISCTKLPYRQRLASRRLLCRNTNITTKHENAELSHQWNKASVSTDTKSYSILTIFPSWFEFSQSHFSILYNCSRSRNFSRIPLLISLLHLTQTFTTLDLRNNQIRAEGAQHLASALRVNTVRINCTTSRHLSTITISYRHSQG